MSIYYFIPLQYYYVHIYQKSAIGGPYSTIEEANLEVAKKNLPPTISKNYVIKQADINGILK